MTQFSTPGAANDQLFNGALHRWSLPKPNSFGIRRKFVRAGRRRLFPIVLLDAIGRDDMFVLFHEIDGFMRGVAFQIDHLTGINTTHSNIRRS